jgi:hypothetical protein
VNLLVAGPPEQRDTIFAQSTKVPSREQRVDPPCDNQITLETGLSDHLTKGREVSVKDDANMECLSIGTAKGRDYGDRVPKRRDLSSTTGVEGGLQIKKTDKIMGVWGGRRVILQPKNTSRSPSPSPDVAGV